VNALAMPLLASMAAQGGLPAYEAMRHAVARCATIDEAAEIRDKAAALAAYARLRDDAELEVWTQEIKLRACRRIGELVRELDSFERTRTDLHDSAVVQKTAAIADARLNLRTAQRYQELAGPRGDDLQAAGSAAAESYFTDARAAKIPATQAGLKAAVTTAVHDAMGPTEIRRAAKDLARETAFIKAARRDEREVRLGEATRVAGARLGSRLYGVLYADPPWRRDVYSRQTGLDRAAENHYPTMPTEDICALAVPAAPDCALFLWATASKLLDALLVVETWGFAYKTQLIWRKPHLGTGYWVRDMHEILLIGTRGDVPAPTPGTQFPSVVEAPRGRHSEKPDVVAEMIARMFPTVPKAELFARAPRPGWDVWGNEAGDIAAGDFAADGSAAA